VSAQLTGQQVLAALAGSLADGTLRLTTGTFGTAVDAALTAWFGGTLVADIGTPQVGANDVAYPDTTLHTAGFALYAARPTVAAAVTVSSDPSGAFQLAVVATMPGGYALADSFPSVATGTAPALAALPLTAATYRVDSTQPAEQVGATLTPDPAGELLDALAWLLPDDATLTGTLTPTTAGGTT
jgi:hypothetical protein